MSAAAERQATNTATWQLSYGWDELNRMTSLGTSTYAYRADGMRGGSTTTLYRYDGQMGFADQEITGAGSVVTHYGLGARGVDFIERVGTSTVTVFPLYDGHGNMVATLSRNGTSYSLNDQRSYGAWGEIRTGASTGDPRGRYVANLGHKQDDESGLIYMRARYYEPSRGRFINQDLAKDGGNWYAYGDNVPTAFADADGTIFWSVTGLLLFLIGQAWSVWSRTQDASIKVHLYGSVALRLIGLAMTVRGCIQTAEWAQEKLHQLKEHNEEIYRELQSQKGTIGPGSRFSRIEAAYMEQFCYLLQLDLESL